MVKRQISRVQFYEDQCQPSNKPKWLIMKFHLTNTFQSSHVNYPSCVNHNPSQSLFKIESFLNPRFFLLCSGWNITLKVTSADVLYCVLPLYHSSAGILGVSTVIVGGATMVVRRKFSASRFWDDCIKYKATVCE